MPTYLDCAATTPIDPRVRDVVVRFLDDEFGNAGSRTHEFGRRARQAVEQARDQVAAVVGCTRGEAVFTSGATESNNLAILGLADLGRRTNRTHVVSTQIEHNAVLEPLQHLASRGFELTMIPPNSGGWVDPERVRAAVRPDTLLVSVMQVNNETGVIQPIADITDAIADHPAYFHVDAAQGFGKELESLRNPRVDLISISGHKLCAPKGVGALITRRRTGERPPLAALTFGGGQERGLRPGTLPVPLVAGLGLAAELAASEWAMRREHASAFRARALAALSPLDPVVNGDPARTLPSILSVSIPNIEAEEAMEALDGIIAISNGSACTSHALACSHVLGAMGLSTERSAGTLRLSWCHLTPEPDWDAVVRVFRELRG